MPSGNQAPAPPPELPSQPGVYQNPRSLGSSIIDDDTNAPITTLKGIVAGTGITVVSLGDDVQINATGGGGVPDASETIKGVLELATQPEVDTGTDDTRAVTALKLRSTTFTTAQIPTLPFSQISGTVPTTQGGTGLTTLGANNTYFLRTNTGATGTEWAVPPPPTIPSASESAEGIIELATQAETNAGTDDARAVTALKLRSTTFTTAQIPTIPFSQISGTVPVVQGGTNLTTLGTANQLLSVNAAGTALEYINPARSALSRVIYVDSIRGNDSTGVMAISATGAIMPFQTLTAAVTYANLVSGFSPVIYLGAGSYTLTSGIALNSGVSIVGLDATDCYITYTATTSDTMLTVGDSSRIEQVSLVMTTSANINIIGVEFPGSTTTSAKLRNVYIEVNASGAGTGTVYGVHVSATSGLPPFFTNIRASTIRTSSVMSGRNRGIYVTGINGRLNCRDIVVWADGAGGNCIGIETNNTSCFLYTAASTIRGVQADVSQTQGSIEVAASCIINANANGLNISQCIASSFVSFACTGTLGTPAGVRWLAIGSKGTTLANEQFITLSRPTLVRNLRVQTDNSGTASRNYDIVIYKNGVSTTLSLNMVGDGAFKTATNLTNSITFAANDRLSCTVTLNGSGTPTADNLVAIVELY